MKILIICPKKYEKCGVFDYSLQMFSVLQREHNISLITNKFEKKDINPKIRDAIKDILPNWKIRGFWQLLKYIIHTKPDFINIQYVPHLYDRWGVNLYLPFAAMILKCLGFKIALTVHENYVPLTNWKWIITGMPQRIILFLLILFSKKTFISIEKWTEKFKRIFYFKKNDISWLPIFSNINYYLINESNKKRIRKQLDFEENDFIIATFSPLHPSKLLNKIFKTWKSVKKNRKDARLLIIGVSKKDIVDCALDFDEDIYCAGYVPERRVGELLSISNIYLSPYSDGISSRRGSALAAMNYGLSIITTKGSSTDSIFHNSPIILVDNPKQLTEKILYFAENKQARIKTGKATKEFYEKYFALDIIKNKFLHQLKE
jgi:glycosyltransferase involved in cell wall biosynthesis